MSTGSPTIARDTALRALGWTRGPLRLGVHEARALCARFGSPLDVYDATVLRGRVAAVRAALGPRVRVLYALKANPNAAVARVAHAAGTGGEVASAGEILVASRAGFAGADLQFAGPGKRDADLATALDAGIGCINLESVREYERLLSLASQRAARPAVAIRVNPGVAAAGARMKMARPSSRFGVDKDQVAPLARRIADDGVCRLVGLHTYSGTQTFEATAFVEASGRLLDLANALEQDTAQLLSTVNFGGGFGAPTFDGDPTFDLATAGDGLRRLVEHDGRDDRRYFVELGRYLVAPCGVYLARVLDVKDSGGKRHAVIDGGLHHHGAACGVGAVLRRPFAVVHADDPVPQEPEPVTLGGPLCTPADELGQDLPLAPLREGDVVAVLNSGAYGLTYSSVMFLGHPMPAEVLVDGEAAHVVRERGTAADALRGQSLPGEPPSANSSTIE